MRECTATKCCRIAWCFMFGRQRGEQLRVWFFHAIRDESAERGVVAVRLLQSGGGGNGGAGQVRGTVKNRLKAQKGNLQTRILALNSPERRNLLRKIVEWASEFSSLRNSSLLVKPPPVTGASKTEADIEAQLSSASRSPRRTSQRISTHGRRLNLNSEVGGGFT